MAIAFHNRTDFKTDLRTLVRTSEGFSAGPINVGDLTVTFGMGYTFVRGGGIYEHLNADLATIGIALTEVQQTELRYIAKIRKQYYSKNTSAADKPAIKAELNEKINAFCLNWGAATITEQQAVTLFNADLAHQELYLKNRFRKLLGTAQGDALYNSQADTREMIALMDLAYNGINTRITKELVDALAIGDRAEAWFQIRYNVNNLRRPEDQNYLAGWAKRFFIDSQIFGLYDDPYNVGLEEAQNVYRMLQRHRDAIVKYEKQWGAPPDGSAPLDKNRIDQANSETSTLVSMNRLGVGNVDTLEDSLNWAKTAILADLRVRYPDLQDKLHDSAFDAFNIYFAERLDANDVGFADSRPYETGIYSDTGTNDLMLGGNGRDILYAGRAGDVLLGEGGNDVLYGEEGNDVLVGGEGDDVLVGGTGVDTLMGGIGNDTYIFDDGADAGLDKIIDSSGQNRIILRSGNSLVSEIGLSAAGIFFADASQTNVWKSADGKLTITHASPYKIILENGHVIQLGDGLEDFHDGDFGIHLRDAISATDTTRTIVGDLAPVDSDASTPGVQYSYDDLGNIIVDPGQTEANREDALYGSSGADLIQGLGGDDYLDGKFGNDRLDGGAGLDRVQGGEGDDVLLGGVDADIVIAGVGDDRLYGNAEIGLADAIAQGISQEASGSKGDWLNGGAGDDIVVGGTGDDALFGGNGQDILVGGAGEDVLNGDDDYTATSVGWTITDAGNPYGFGRLYSPITTDSPPEGAADQLYGGAGDDYLFGGFGDDLLFGELGNDIMMGASDDDTLFGGDGDDKMTGDYGQMVYDSGFGAVIQGSDYLDGGAGDDFMQGEGDADQLYGGSGNDELWGDAKTYTDASLDGNDYLDGEDGNDKLVGQGGDDQLFGGADDDELFGDSDQTPVSEHGNDYLDGEAGNDYLRGYGGNDEMFGGEGDDQLLAEDGDDYLDGESGKDMLDGGAGNDMLFGGAGDDELGGGDGDDVLEGEEGADSLAGGAGNDELNGGDGADYLAGGAGDDTYLNVDADDTIVDTEGQNVIRFAEGIDLDDIGATNVTTDGVQSLVLDIGGRAFLTIQSDQARSFETYEFADETQLTHEEFLGHRLFQASSGSGTMGDDTLHGYAGDDAINGGGGNDELFGHLGDDTLRGDTGSDTLAGGEGNDTLVGGEGNDTYLFRRGDGHDVIDDEGGIADENVIRFATDISQADVTMTRLASGDLLLQVDGGADQITIRGWFNSPNNRIERIEFGDGSFLTSADLDGLAVAPIKGSEYADTISGTVHSDTILGYGGEDIIDGNAGDDQTEGGDGADTYVLKFGMGRDTVVDASIDGNTIKLAGGVDFANLDARRNGNDLFVHITGTEQGMVLKDYYANPQSWIVEDAQGVQKDVEQVVAATQSAEQDKVGMMWREYLAQIRSSAISEFTQQGYILRDDGTFYRSWAASGTGLNAAVSESKTTVTTTIDWQPGYNDGATSTTVDVTENNTWDMGRRQLDNSIIAFDNAIIHIEEAETSIHDWYSWQSTSEAVIVEAEWKPLSWNFGANQTTATQVQLIMGGPNGDETAGVMTTETTQRSRNTYASGTILGILPAESATSGAGYSPRYVQADFNNLTTTYTVRQVYADASDNLIYVYRGTPASILIDAGAGNDTVIGAGLAYGGAGDDYLRDGDVLIGGEGNDILLEGDVLAGGAGDDFMDGGYSATRYLIDPNDFGFDTIADSGPEGEYETGVPIADTLEFGAGLVLDDLAVRWASDGSEEDSARWLSLSWGEGKRIRMNGIELVKFHDGTVWDVSDLEERAAAVGMAADDILYGGRFNDTMAGSGGNDALYGYEGSDTLDGGTGNDELNGGTGNDTLVGGAGNDALFGGSGNDVYVFGIGSGIDAVHDSVFEDDSGMDTIRMTSGVLPSDVTVTRDQHNLHLILNGDSDQLMLADWFADAGHRAKQVVFADGTVWDAATLERFISYAPTPGADYLEGTPDTDDLATLAGDDTIVGLEGDDILAGGAGNDLLLGGQGNDVYLFSRGDGNDTIIDFSEGAGIVNVVRFDASISASEVIVTCSQTDLFLSVEGTMDRLVLSNWFANRAYPIDRVEFEDGTIWNPVELLAKIPNSPTDGDDFLRGGSGSDNLSGLAGNDRIQAGAGDDVVSGGTGNDIYMYSLGDGSDVIDDVDETVGNIDTIRFDESVGSADITVTRDLVNLFLTVNGTGDTITLQNWFTGNANKIELIEFADGNVWTASDLIARISRVATEGDDVLVGSEGQDWIAGLGGNDQLYGGAGGDDTLSGDAGDDTLVGEAGNDWLDGGAGNDALDGGKGSDQLHGGAGNDVYFFGRGAGRDSIYDYDDSPGNMDVVRFDATISVADVIVTRDSNHLYLSTQGNAERITLHDWFASDAHKIERVEFADGTVWSVDDLESSALYVVRGSGDADSLFGEPGASLIKGFEGDDELYGQIGDDVLNGGAGNDYLAGGAGNDTYVFSRGDGQDTINNFDFEVDVGKIDTVSFDATVSADEVRVSRDSESLYLSIDGTTDRIEISRWFSDDATIEQVKFADGTVWNQADLMARIISEPTEGADYLEGTNDSDIMLGLGGDDELYGGFNNDFLFGGEGDDLLSDSKGSNVLDGGNGNDTLWGDYEANFIIGGAGDDTIDCYGENHVIAFNRGDGVDNVAIYGAFTLSLGGGIAVEDLSLGIDGSDYLLYTGDGDRIRLIFTDVETPFVRLQIIGADTRTYDLTALISSFESALASGITWSTQDALNANLLNASTDEVIGGDLAYRYAKDGNLASLTIDAMRTTLSDPDFGVAAQLLNVDAPVNAPPVLNTSIEDQVTSQGTLFVFQIPVGTFSDPDVDDQLTLQATLDDGNALPDWLQFDASTGTFSGTPNNAAVGDVAVRISAVDGAGAAVEAGFTLTVNNLNDAPVVAQTIEAASATQGQAFAFTIPVGTFVDLDADDTLTYNATLSNGDPLPTWLTFDAATGTFSGTPANSDVGLVGVVVTAVDGSGATASSTFDLDVANVNDAPTVAFPISDQAAVEDAVFAYTLPPDAFQDVDVGDSLTYAVTLANGDPLPGWLTFDPETRTLSGTPGAGQVGSLSIRVAATDIGGLIASDTFELKVAAINRTLTGTAGADTIAGGAGDDTITDSNGSDTIDGGAGNDMITDQGNGTNVLRGGDGNDAITFSHVANNTVEGGAGDDVLKVGSLAHGSRLYANTIVGGAGKDRMESGGSADTYLFNRGDGQDVIRDYDYEHGEKLDRVVFGAGIAASDVTVSRSGNHLVLKVNDPANPAASEQITIEDWNINRWYRLEQVVFADGTTWSTAQLSNLAVAGTEGDDSIEGWWDSNVIDGKGGNDTIKTWSGYDSVYGGDGNDTVYSGDGNDTVYGGDGNDTITDTGGSDTIDGGAGDDVIDDIDAVGTNVLRGGDGNDTIKFGNGRNTIEGGLGDDLILQSNIGPSNNANTIAGGQGNDRMEGGGSPDTYLFARGDGQDTIRDSDFLGMGKLDRVVFGAGIAASDVTVSRSGNHLVLKVNDPANPAATDQITIEDWNTSGGLYRLEQVVFADGTTWTTAQIDAMAVTLTGTDGADTVNGWSVIDIIYGLDGNDTITGLDGNDLLNGGLGNDTLDGGAGNDLFIGASGDDLIVTGAGADVIAFNRGDGQDVIAASTGTDNTVSLGHGIQYVDLLFQKSNNDLTLQTGAGEQLTFKDWYSNVSNRSVATLQMVIEGTADYDAASANQLNNKKVQQFHFAGLVAKFDSARNAGSTLTSWSLSSSLLEFHLNGSSDTAALGSDLAYQYAKNGNLSTISASPAQAILASTQFGAANQNLQPSSALQDLTPRLM